MKARTAAPIFGLVCQQEFDGDEAVADLGAHRSVEDAGMDPPMAEVQRVPLSALLEFEHFRQVVQVPAAADEVIEIGAEGRVTDQVAEGRAPRLGPFDGVPVLGPGCPSKRGRAEGGVLKRRPPMFVLVQSLVQRRYVVR